MYKKLPLVVGSLTNLTLVVFIYMFTSHLSTRLPIHVVQFSVAEVLGLLMITSHTLCS